MDFRMIKLFLALAAVLLLTPNISMATPSLITGKATVKNGILTLTEGAYELSFIKKSSWTIRQMLFDEKLLLSPTGAFGTVANTKNIGWAGTGHGNETVEKVALEVDGKSHSLDEGLDVSGSKFILFKQSVIGPYRQFDTITCDGARIVEDFQYEIIADDSNVNFMYAFMHCFTNKTDRWMAEDKEGNIENGQFRDDASFTLEKDIRWAAVYDSPEQIGLVYVYPKVYEGKKPFLNSFWNRLHDNKLYFRPELPTGIGQKFGFQVTLQAFNAPASDWQKTAKTLITDIEQTPAT